MLALKISDIKDFMNKLLIGEVFDHFSFIESSITTFNTFTIDGKLQHDFFDTDTHRPALQDIPHTWFLSVLYPEPVYSASFSVYVNFQFFLCTTLHISCLHHSKKTDGNPSVYRVIVAVQLPAFSCDALTVTVSP